MFKIDFMKYKVIKQIPQTSEGVSAKVGDILTVGWYNQDGGCWALYKNEDYVCDLGSRYGTHHCEEITPIIDNKDIFSSIYSQDFKSESHGWIQWKGTDVCMDIHCKCGHFGHIDADFFYCYKCPKCDRKYAVGQNVKLIELNQSQEEYLNQYHAFISDEIEVD